MDKQDILERVRKDGEALRLVSPELQSDKDFVSTKEFLGGYSITPYTYKQAKRLGVTVKPSTNPTKKIDVFKGKKIASVGAKGMMDYPTYQKVKGKVYATKRRELYKMRHKKDRTRKGTPGYYADQLLW